MNSFLKCIGALVVAVLAFAGTATAQPVQDLSIQPPYNPTRVNFYNVYVADVPLTAIGGTGHVFSSTSLSNGTQDVSLSAANDPDSPRELVIFQSENSGSALSVTYAINYTSWDATDTTYTLTLNSTDNYAFKLPALGVNRLFITISGAATSDSIKIGYRGFWVPGSYPTAANQVVFESVNGVVPGTAATIPQNGFVLPNSVSATNNYLVGIRSTTVTQKYYLQNIIGYENPTVRLGTNP